MAYNQGDVTFAATDKFSVSGSSFVEEVAYDADERELLVFFRSGSGYLYKGVSLGTFRDFQNAHSKGQFYNNWIKRGGYGPGVEVYWDTEVVEKTYPRQDFSDVLGVNPVSTTAVAPVRVSPSGSTGTFTFPTYSLTALDIDVKVNKPHRVEFTVEDGNEVKSYNVDAESVDEAVEALAEIGMSLGLELNVKGVYVSFE
jgi:hypothetical protein